jgi:CubicO group peptidase (beta-lactamase class C family)
MKLIFRISLLFTLLFLLSNCNSFAQKKDNYTVQIDSLITIVEPKFNGVILITQKGKTLYNKAYGFANFETKKPLKLDSQFEIMSNSKQIAAVLILLEVEKGKIDLNAPIKKYLPELTQSWADSVTVHQLLNHSHGIIDLQKPLLFKPGTQFKYGNLNFSLLGKIVEFSTQKRYSEVADSLFKKLKMNHTFCYSKDKTQNLATGYYNAKNVLNPVNSSQINSENLGADGIISTAEDLAIWNNNLHRGKMLQPESYKMMTTNTILSQHDFFGKEKEGYGYGIRVIEKNSVKHLGHTGLGDGFSSVNLYFPKNDISMIVLENQMNEDSNLFYASAFEIKKILLKSNLFNKD